MTIKDSFVIQRINSGFPQDYWNNRDGWVSIDDAEIFSHSETEKLNLPIGGTWILLTKAIFDFPVNNH